MIILATLLSLQSVQGMAERSQSDLEDLLVGDWNNQDQVYFAGEVNIEPPARTHFRVEKNDSGQLILLSGPSSDDLSPAQTWVMSSNQQGKIVLNISTPEQSGSCELDVQREGEAFRFSEGNRNCKKLNISPVSASAAMLRVSAYGDELIEARKSQWFSCWVSQNREDDSWTFVPNLKVHDQGGFIWAPSEEGVTRPAGLKMRNVRWPYGRNRDSLVLYIHDDEDAPAVSYVWTEPESKRIAVNLRWIQTSCTLIE